jgi:hypothetical protein
MPNWVFQDLHVVGSPETLDRFIERGFTRKAAGEIDDLLHFTRLCPLKRGDGKRTYSHDSGVVLRHFRTRTQVLFSMMTSWNYPAEFYSRLPKHWPELSFVCTVNEDMEQFGGIVMGLEGTAVDLVRKYDDCYDPRAHRREVRAALRDWFRFLTDGRDWRLMADTGRRRSVPFDAHFDDDERFYFRSREDLARFKQKIKSGAVMKRTGKMWRGARA